MAQEAPLARQWASLSLFGVSPRLFVLPLFTFFFVFRTGTLFRKYYSVSFHDFSIVIWQ
jgi:hypothetical protein